MIWTIAKREFLEKILDFRVIISFVIAIALIIITTLVAGGDYFAKKAEYDMLVTNGKAGMNNVHVYSQYKPVLYFPPSPLSVFGRGIDIPTPVTANIIIQEVPVYRPTETGTNPMMKMFDTLDIATVVRVLFGLLVILLTFDSFSGEKEAGTLRLTLSNPVARMNLLYGKFIGVIMIVGVIVILMYLITIVLLRFSTGFGFTSEDYVRVLLTTGATVLYLALFAAVGIFASIKFHHSSTSLAVLLLVWFVVAILQPNVNTYIVSEFENKQWRENYESALDNDDCGAERELEQLQKERGSVVNDRSKRNFGESTIGLAGSGVSNSVRMEAMIADADYDLLEYTVRQVQILRNMAGCADKDFDLYKNLYLDHLDKQLGWKRTLDLFSPAALFSHCVSILSRTDIDNVDGFYEQARNYRTQYLTYLDQKGVFSTNAQLFFTRLNKEQIDRQATEQRLREYEKGLRSPPWVSRQPPLDLRDAPIFTPQQSSLTTDFAKATGSLGLLLCYLALFFFWTGKSMKSYDPR